MEKFRSQFTKCALESVFPWVDHIRAGILLVHNGKLLLVREKTSCNIGPPKGLADWSVDATAFDTAMRELLEETGLNLKNKSIAVCTNIYMYPRKHCKELMIYFAVFINFKPRLYIRNNEISAYIWSDLKDGLSGKYKCSEASSVLYRAIDNSMLHKCTNVIHVQSCKYNSRDDNARFEQGVRRKRYKINHRWVDRSR